MESSADIWAEWVLGRSHGGDPEQRRRSAEWLAPIRDRVLANGAVRLGDVVLDAGAGDGLIGLGALPLVGPEGRVIFSDISGPLLERCREAAPAAGALGRCEFVQAPVEDLAAIPDGSVDVATVRSVLIYVRDKPAAFGELHRVLCHGGRLSIFEPINRWFLETPDRFWAYDVSAVREIAGKVKAVYERIQPRATDPMLDFDEHDLVAMAEGAGFGEVHLDVSVRVGPIEWVTGWEAYRATAPNPRVPTLEEAMQEALTPEEAATFEAHLRPLVDAGEGVHRSAHAYLWARKG